MQSVAAGTGTWIEVRPADPMRPVHAGTAVAAVQGTCCRTEAGEPGADPVHQTVHRQAGRK